VELLCFQIVRPASGAEARRGRAGRRRAAAATVKAPYTSCVARPRGSFRDLRRRGFQRSRIHKKINHRFPWGETSKRPAKPTRGSKARGPMTQGKGRNPARIEASKRALSGGRVDNISNFTMKFKLSICEVLILLFHKNSEIRVNFIFF
jgi:hypothetical protein